MHLILWEFIIVRTKLWHPAVKISHSRGTEKLLRCPLLPFPSLQLCSFLPLACWDGWPCLSPGRVRPLPLGLLAGLQGEVGHSEGGSCPGGWVQNGLVSQKREVCSALEGARDTLSSSCPESQPATGSIWVWSRSIWSNPEGQEGLCLLQPGVKE